MTQKSGRKERMLEAARNGFVSEYMRLGIYEELEEQGIPSPTLAPHMLNDLSVRLKEPIVNLSAGGQITTRCPDIVAQATKRAVDEGFTQSGGKGYKSFRRLLTEKLARENGIEVDEETELQPSIGAQLSLFGVVHIVVHPGDNVLIIDPEYAAFEPIVRMVRGNPISVPLQEEGAKWQIDLDELERRITNRTRMLFLSNGNNPTGLLYTRMQLEEIAALAQKHDFIVLSDEEYEKIVFEGQHHSIASLPGMKERTVTIFSYSKTYSMSGFRIGYMTAPSWIIDYMQDIIRLTVQSIPSISQLAAQALLEDDHSDWLSKTLAQLQHKRDIGVQMLNEMPGIQCAIPHGCYFLFPNIKTLGLSSLEFVCQLLEEERVKVLPGFYFGKNGEGHVRVSACVGEEEIVEGLTRMARFVERVMDKRKGS